MFLPLNLPVLLLVPAVAPPVETLIAAREHHYRRGQMFTEIRVWRSYPRGPGHWMLIEVPLCFRLFIDPWTAAAPPLTPALSPGGEREPDKEDPCHVLPQ
jgi:hypothetical protein